MLIRSRLHLAKRAGSLSLATVLVAGSAWAASSFTYTDSHTTSKSPDHAWTVMTAYAETCDSGCKYYRPDLVRVTKVKYGQSKNSWYTWTHVGSTLKDAKYFTKVTLSKKSDGNFFANNQQVKNNEKELIAALEKDSGLKHSPIFDGGGTKTSTKTVNGKTVLTQTISVYTGSFVGLWEGKIRDGMKKAMDATFRNIGD